MLRLLIELLLALLLMVPSQIAKFMGPTWGPPASCRPHEPWYQGLCSCWCRCSASTINAAFGLNLQQTVWLLFFRVIIAWSLTLGGGVIRKEFDRGVRLRFSIGYPWLRKFWLKTYPFQHFLIMSPFLHDFKEFQPQSSLLKRNFSKTNANLATKCHVLGVFVKNTPLAKDFARKIYPWLRNQGSKSDPWERPNHTHTHTPHTHSQWGQSFTSMWYNPEAWILKPGTRPARPSRCWALTIIA